MKRPFRITEAERSTRSERLRALNASPEFRAKVIAGRAACETSPARKKQMGQVMKKLRLKPGFEEKRKRPRKVVVPEHAHPVVRALFSQINEQCSMLCEVESRSGLCAGTVADWRRRNPIVQNLDAALNALDLELAIVPIGSRDENGFVKKRTYTRRSPQSTEGLV